MKNRRKERQNWINSIALHACLIGSFALAVIAYCCGWPDKYYYGATAAHVGSYCLLTARYTYCNVRELGIRCTRYNEVVLLIARWMHFALAAGIAFYSVYDKVLVPARVILPVALLLFMGLYKSFSRTTFRIFPSVLLAFAATLHFFVFTGFSYKVSEKQLLWELIDGARWANYLNKLPPIFTNSAVIVAISPLFLAVAKYLIEKYRTQAGENPLKITRRQLLTHAWYNPKTVVNDNAIIWISVALILVCLVSVVLNLPKVETNETVETTQSESINFLEYLSIFASAITVMGIIWLVEIQERELLRCEHYYLKYYAPMVGNLCIEETECAIPQKRRMESRLIQLIRYLENRELIEKDSLIYRFLIYLATLRCTGLRTLLNRAKAYTAKRGKEILAHLTRRMYGGARGEKALRWLRDYCQVLGHLFSGASEIRSEDEDAHDISKVIGEIGADIKEPKTKSVAVTEMMYAFQKALRKTQAEVKQAKGAEKNAESEKQQKTTTEGEILFAEAIRKFIDNAARENCCLMLESLKDAQDIMDDVLRGIKVNFNIGKHYSLTEFERIVNVEVMRRIASRQGKSRCVFSWLCDENCECNDGQKHLDQKMLLLVYPVLTICSIAEYYPEEEINNADWELVTESIIKGFFNEIVKKNTGNSKSEFAVNEEQMEIPEEEEKVRGAEEEKDKKDFLNAFFILNEIINGQEVGIKDQIIRAISNYDFINSAQGEEQPDSFPLEEDEIKEVKTQFYAGMMRRVNMVKMSKTNENNLKEQDAAWEPADDRKRKADEDYGEFNGYVNGCYEIFCATKLKKRESGQDV